MNHELVVANSTSAACEAIFGQPIANKKLSSILNLKVEELERHLCLALEQIFDDFMPEEVSVSLLPNVVETKDHKFVDLNYTVVRDDSNKITKVIIAATDISESVRERQEIEKKFVENRCVINILKHLDAFRDFVASFKSGIEQAKRENNSDTKKNSTYLKGKLLGI